jgi:hypothetical protein
MPKIVMLDWSSRRFEVTEEGYEQIKALNRVTQVGPTCRERIDEEEHLLVGKNCKACVLSSNPSLTFVGLHHTDNDGDKHYSFLNAQGITLTSEENSSEKPEQDIALSIEQAGFSVPVSYKPLKSTEEVQLFRSGWQFAGKLDQSVVILRHVDYYSKRNEVDFIAYKFGDTMEFNKRTTAHKNILETALNLATRAKKRTDEVSLFEIMAMIESSNYEAQLVFLAMQEPEQPELLPETTQEQPEEILPVEEIVTDFPSNHEITSLQELEITQESTPEASDEPVQLTSRRKRKQETTSDDSTLQQE